MPPRAPARVLAVVLVAGVGNRVGKAGGGAMLGDFAQMGVWANEAQRLLLAEQQGDTLTRLLWWRAVDLTRSARDRDEWTGTLPYTAGRYPTSSRLWTEPGM